MKRNLVAPAAGTSVSRIGFCGLRHAVWDSLLRQVGQMSGSPDIPSSENKGVAFTLAQVCSQAELAWWLSEEQPPEAPCQHTGSLLLSLTGTRVSSLSICAAWIWEQPHLNLCMRPSYLVRFVHACIHSFIHSLHMYRMHSVTQHLTRCYRWVPL